MPSDMYIKLDKVDGEATDSAHDKWIELLSWSTGVSQGASAISAVTGQTSGVADVQEFQFTHAMDLSSPKLWELSCTGETVPKVVFEQQKAQGKEKLIFLKITLENAIVSSVQPAGGMGSQPMESVGLRFARIEYDYKQLKDDGSPGGNLSAKWNLKTSKAE